MTRSDATVLVVDDDPDIRELLRNVLGRAGFAVVEAADGQEGLRALFASRPELVILDVSMPQLDGWETLARIREVSDVPVLMVTASGTELERVRGLMGGADDYLTKPFGRHELTARVQALLRRARQGDAGHERYIDDLLTIDFGQRSVVYDGREVLLTPLEYRLLAAFARHPNHILSPPQLLELVWGDPYGVSPDQVKLYVSYLRRKLDPEEPARVPIETVRGFGYRYRPPSAGTGAKSS